MNAAERYSNWFADRGTQAAEPDWLQVARQSAFDHFAQTGFPKPREELWKYTRTDAIERTAFALSESDTSSALDGDLSDLSLGLDAYTMAFVDGHFRADLSSKELLAGLRFAGSLEQAIDTRAQALSQVFGQVANNNAHAFTALNPALTRQGAFIEVDAHAGVLEQLAHQPIDCRLVGHQSAIDRAKPGIFPGQR